MIERQSENAPLWAMGRFPLLIQIDARRVRAGSDAWISTAQRGGNQVPIPPEDLDRFAREWLAFREETA